MEKEYQKNSLLGQLEEKGFLQESKKQEVSSPFETEKIFKTYGNNLNNQENKEYTSPKTRIVKNRLNDLDLNIFQESNFLDIDDNELTDAEKARKIKIMIRKLDKKLFMLEDSDDEILIQKLKDEKEALNDVLNLLDSKKKFKTPKIKEIDKKIKIAINILFKIFPFIKRNYLVHHALNKLVILNENTTELMSKKIPYGESEGRYNDFIAYINCANIIHAKLKKKINKG